MRTLHIVAKGWGLGLIVDYEGEPKKPAKAPPPVRTDKSVTRVTPQPVRRRRPQGDGWPEHLCWVSGLTVFGLFFGYLGLQGGGPAALTARFPRTGGAGARKDQRFSSARTQPRSGCAKASENPARLSMATRACASAWLLSVPDVKA